MPKGATFINLRVKVLRRMRLSEAVAKLDRAIATGFVPDDIEIAYIDWQSGKGRHLRGDTYTDQDALDALSQARTILTAPGTKTRVAVVDKE